MYISIILKHYVLLLDSQNIYIGKNLNDERIFIEADIIEENSGLLVKDLNLGPDDLINIEIRE